MMVDDNNDDNYNKDDDGDGDGDDKIISYTNGRMKIWNGMFQRIVVYKTKRNNTYLLYCTVLYCITVPTTSYESNQLDPKKLGKMGHSIFS
jgi:hypothetical protein